jgi:hypothetical protein
VWDLRGGGMGGCAGCAGDERDEVRGEGEQRGWRVRVVEVTCAAEAWTGAPGKSEKAGISSKWTEKEMVPSPERSGTSVKLRVLPFSRPFNEASSLPRRRAFHRREKECS